MKPVKDMKITLKEKTPRVLVLFSSTRQRKALEDEYGVNTVAKIVAGAMNDANPDAESFRVQLPPGKNDPLISLATVGEREAFKVAVFARGEYIESSNILEFVFRGVEPAYVDEEEIKAKAAMFRPGLVYPNAR